MIETLLWIGISATGSIYVSILVLERVANTSGRHAYNMIDKKDLVTVESLITRN